MVEIPEEYRELVDAGVPSDRIADAFRILPKARIVRVFEDREGRPTGIIVGFPSESRRGVWHWATVGLYAAKCVCEWSTMRHGLCKHIVAAYILLKRVARERGFDINLAEIEPLRRLAEAERGLGERERSRA